MAASNKYYAVQAHDGIHVIDSITNFTEVVVPDEEELENFISANTNASDMDSIYAAEGITIQ